MIPSIPIPHHKVHSCLTPFHICKTPKDIRWSSCWVGRGRCNSSPAWCYNFSSHHFFACVLHSFTCCISVQFYILKTLLRLSLLAADYSLSMLFHFQMFEDFLVVLLLLLSGLLPLWSENIVYMILILLSVLKFILWPRIWPRSTLVNVPWVLEKNV